MARPCKELWHRWHHQTAERQRYHIEEATRTVRSRGDANTPAHQILKQAVHVKSRHRPNAQWRRPPGRPRNSWLQQVDNGSLTGSRQSWRAARSWALRVVATGFRCLCGVCATMMMMIMVIFSLCLSSLNPARESGWAVKILVSCTHWKWFWGTTAYFAAAFRVPPSCPQEQSSYF